MRLGPELDEGKVLFEIVDIHIRELNNIDAINYIRLKRHVDKLINILNKSDFEIDSITKDKLILNNSFDVGTRMKTQGKTKACKYLA